MTGLLTEMRSVFLIGTTQAVNSAPGCQGVT